MTPDERRHATHVAAELRKAWGAHASRSEWQGRMRWVAPVLTLGAVAAFAWPGELLHFMRFALPVVAVLSTPLWLEGLRAVRK